MGLEREPWLLHSLGCYLSTPQVAWRSGLLLGCMWGWGDDRVRDTEFGELVAPVDGGAVTHALHSCLPGDSICKGEENEKGLKSW